jgi:hypothetical protein
MYDRSIKRLAEYDDVNNAFREGVFVQSNLLIWNSASNPTHESTCCPPRLSKTCAFR